MLYLMYITEGSFTVEYTVQDDIRFGMIFCRSHVRHRDKSILKKRHGIERNNALLYTYN